MPSTAKSSLIITATPAFVLYANSFVKDVVRLVQTSSPPTTSLCHLDYLLKFYDADELGQFRMQLDASDARLINMLFLIAKDHIPSIRHKMISAEWNICIFSFNVIIEAVD